MAYLEQILIRGIRSIGPSEDDTHLIQFLNPLTIISGPNGTGKTTLIEALNYITSSDLPAGKLATFMHSLQVFNCNLFFYYDLMCKFKVARKPRVDAMIKLQFVDSKKRRCVATKRMNSTLSKGGKLQYNNKGWSHTEPLSEPKELKTRFDRIFQLTKFVKALDNMKKLKRDYVGFSIVFDLIHNLSLDMTYIILIMFVSGRRTKNTRGKTDKQRDDRDS
uniref:AAA_23 domain-containing protein n=1 Tax=Heterorhabditis bacteriophora TaxID=37862 RepID=A0A1I7XM15_HETBA